MLDIGYNKVSEFYRTLNTIVIIVTIKFVSFFFSMTEIISILISRMTNHFTPKSHAIFNLSVCYWLQFLACDDDTVVTSKWPWRDESDSFRLYSMKLVTNINIWNCKKLSPVLDSTMLSDWYHLIRVTYDTWWQDSRKFKQIVRFTPVAYMLQIGYGTCERRRVFSIFCAFQWTMV